jgi:hypothetical protein
MDGVEKAEVMDDPLSELIKRFLQQEKVRKNAAIQTVPHNEHLKSLQVKVIADAVKTGKPLTATFEKPIKKEQKKKKGRVAKVKVAAKLNVLGVGKLSEKTNKKTSKNQKVQGMDEREWREHKQLVIKLASASPEFIQNSMGLSFEQKYELASNVFKKRGQDRLKARELRLAKGKKQKNNNPNRGKSKSKGRRSSSLYTMSGGLPSLGKKRR